MICVAALSTQAIAQQPGRHQTDEVTPILFDSDLPYKIQLRQYDFGAAAPPTLHSYAAGEHDGKWVLIAGRTNGLHGFDVNGVGNFPIESQNREVWVIDPVAKQSWSRTLDTSQGLSQFQVNALTPTNNQFYQSGDTLYMTGGYGVRSVETDGTENFGTFDTLSAINLPDLVDWVLTGAGQAADSIRQIQSPTVKVTGGAMYEIAGRTHLVFGQDFDGVYSPATNGAYTKQVRSFDIVDDGVNLSIENIAATPPLDEYRRRDLNVFPVLRPTESGPQQGLTVLSGVFTPTFGAWTVPVEIDADGNPTMADPDAPDIFKQGFNGYHSAKLGLYSEATGEMNEILFGGISLQTYNTDTEQVETDDSLPFINDITSVVVDPDGAYGQHWLGEFPELFDQDGKRLRFGANAEFFPAEGVATYENNVIQLDQLTGELTLGYIFGGLAANGPHTRRDPDVISAASNVIFEVVYTVVPEPSSTTIAMFLSIACVGCRRRGRGGSCLK